MILRRTDSWIHIIDTRIICFCARARTIGKENNAFMIKLSKDSQRLMNADPMIVKEIRIPQDVLKTILKKSLEFLRTHTSTNDPNRLRVATAKILCS